MARPLTRRMIIAGILAAATTSHAASGLRPYTLHPGGSQITFLFDTNGTTQTGTVPVRMADIRIDTTNLARSTAEVTADIRKLRTGLLFITQAIKSPELLDAKAHPLVRFQSTEIRLGARGRISEGAEIDGLLTLRGVTRPLTLSATLSRPAGTKADDLDTLYVRLKGSISRSDYGATGYPGLAEDRVNLDIRAEIRANV